MPLSILRGGPYRHDLIALKVEASKRRVARHARLTHVQHLAIRMLSPFYAGKHLEYPPELGAPGGFAVYRLPSPRPLFEAADLLVRGLRGYCHGRTVAMIAARWKKLRCVSKRLWFSNGGRSGRVPLLAQASPSWDGEHVLEMKLSEVLE